MCNHLNIKCFDEGYGIYNFMCNDCDANVQPRLNEHNLWEWIVEHQCENCDAHYITEPVPFPDPDSKYARATFCCDECAREAYEEVLVHAREDAREYEMWGTDYDSWYR